MDFKTDRGQLSCTYKEAYANAEGRLRQLGVAHTPLDPERMEKIISKPYARLEHDERGFLERALEHYFAVDVPSGDLETIRRRSITRAQKRAAREDTIDDPGVWSDLFAGCTRGSQELFRSLEGEYLMFRRVFSRPALIVGYMKLTAGKSEHDPARFSTLGAGDQAQDAKRVDGVMFVPASAPQRIFALGRVLGTEELRSSILTPQDKPDPDAPPEKDLVGVRLGLGYIDRLPRGYRLWCSRLTRPLPGGRDPRSLVKEYRNDEPMGFFEENVEGFRYIRKWLSVPAYASLRHDDDPTSPAPWSDEP